MSTLNYGWPGAIQPSGGWPGAIQPLDGGGGGTTYSQLWWNMAYDYQGSGI